MSDEQIAYETFEYTVLPFGFYYLKTGDPESFFYLGDEPVPQFRRTFGRLFRIAGEKRITFIETRRAK